MGISVAVAVGGKKVDVGVDVGVGVMGISVAVAVGGKEVAVTQVSSCDR